MRIIAPKAHAHSLFSSPITVVANTGTGQVAFANVTEVYASHRTGVLTFISKGKTLGSVVVHIAENALAPVPRKSARMAENFVVLAGRGLKEDENHEMWNLIGFAVDGDESRPWAEI